jgi:hypothetical protein
VLFFVFGGSYMDKGQGREKKIIDSI